MKQTVETGLSDEVQTHFMRVVSIHGRLLNKDVTNNSNDDDDDDDNNNDELNNNNDDVYDDARRRCFVQLPSHFHWLLSFFVALVLLYTNSTAR